MCLEAIFSLVPVGRDGYTGLSGRAPASSKAPTVRSVLGMPALVARPRHAGGELPLSQRKKMTGALVHLRPSTPIM